MSELRKWIAARLRRGESVVLAAVTRVSGSTSRGTDALLAMDSTGAMNGTVGGGFIEGQTIETARRMLGLGGSQAGAQMSTVQLPGAQIPAAHPPTAEIATVQSPGAQIPAAHPPTAEIATAQSPGSSQDLDFDLTPEANQTQMTCGGRLSIHLEKLEPQSMAARALLACIDSVEKGRPCAFVVVRTPHAQYSFAFDEGANDSAAIPAPLLDSLRANMPVLEGAAEFEIEDSSNAAQEKAHVFWLGLLPDPQVYIFGAGHVGKAVCDFASLTGFRVIVTDDRPDMLTTERFPRASELRLIHSFEDALTDASGAPAVSIGPQDCALVLTRKPDIDKAMLAQVLRTNAGYIGLIGSKSKRDGIFAALKAEGFADADIARVHAPIGLAIGARTPEEIAVSILAEIIAVRAGIQAPAGILPQAPHSGFSGHSGYSLQQPHSGYSPQQPHSGLSGHSGAQAPAGTNKIMPR